MENDIIISGFKIIQSNDDKITVKDDCEIIPIKGKYKLNLTKLENNKVYKIINNCYSPQYMLYTKESSKDKYQLSATNILYNDIINNKYNFKKYKFVYAIKVEAIVNHYENNYFNISNDNYKEYKHILDHINNNIKDNLDIVCYGKKNSGKSTLVNCLLNTMATKYPNKKILLTDLDIGQSIIFYPGFVYTYEWNTHKFINGSNINYNINYENLKLCYYIGETTYNNKINYYLNSLNKIKEYINNNYDNYINIINYNGFIKSLGNIVSKEVFKIFKFNLIIGLNYDIKLASHYLQFDKIINIKNNDVKNIRKNYQILNTLLHCNNNIEIELKDDNLVAFLVIKENEIKTISEINEIFLVYILSFVFVVYTDNNNSNKYSVGFILNIKNNKLLLKVSNIIDSYKSITIIKSNMIDLPLDFLIKNNGIVDSKIYNNNIFLDLLGSKPYKNRVSKKKLN